MEALDVPGVLTALELGGRVVAGGRVETYPFRLPLSLPARLALVRAGLRIRLGVARYDRVLATGDARRILAYRADRTFAEWLGPVPERLPLVLEARLEVPQHLPDRLKLSLD